MVISQDGAAGTPHAQRYLKQLGKHWSHRFKVVEENGVVLVDFGEGSSVTMSATDRQMSFSICGELEELAILRNVVEEHVNRFAFKEGALRYSWESVTE